MNNYELKISPATLELIKPIIGEMTQVDIMQKNQPMLLAREPEYIKEAKKGCVHFVIENGAPKLCLEKTSEGLVCTACGRKVAESFDPANIDILLKANEIINQTLFFGLINGLQDGPVSTLISVKRVMPSIIQLYEQLSKFVAQDDASNNGATDLVGNYNAPTSNGITTLFR